MGKYLTNVSGNGDNFCTPWICATLLKQKIIKRQILTFITMIIRPDLNNGSGSMDKF